MKMIILLAILLASTVQAADLPITKPDGECSGFDTITSAATAALSKATKLSTEFEYGGAIFEHKGSFCFTEPVTINDEYAVNYRIALPSGYKLVALYHTHPGDGKSKSEFFSANDVDTSRQLKLPMYIGIIARSQVKRFDPTKNGTQNVGPYDYYARGTLVASLEMMN